MAAQRYARALFELAHEEGEDEHVEAELEAFSAALKSSPGTERFLSNPALNGLQKKQIIGKLFSGRKPKIDTLLTRFLLVLFQKNRFYLIHDVASSFRKIADESQGQGVLEIRTASALSDMQRSSLVARAERLSGKKMVVHTEVDPTIFGGVILKMGNKVIDDSVRAKLGNFKKELTASQSI